MKWLRFTKFSSSEYEILQVILIYELIQLVTTAARLDTIRLYKWYAHTHTHTHNFPLEILIWVPETLNIFEQISFITRIIATFCKRDWEALWRTSVGKSVLQFWFETTTGLIQVRSINSCSIFFDRIREAFSFLSFFLILNSSTHSCRCRGGLLHLVTLNDTHTHSLSLFRTPLEEGSARRRDLSLTTHNTYKRQISMPQTVFEPINAASKRPQTYCLRTRSRCDKASI